MRGGGGRIVDIDNLAEFDHHVASGAVSMRGWRIQDVDLRGRSDALMSRGATGAVLLGCDLTPQTEAELVRRGAVVFQDVPEVPFNAYRSTLYTPDELMGGTDGDDGGGGEYRDRFDAKVYAWSRSADHDVARTISAAIHDHAIDGALAEWLVGHRLVGVMGGHALPRGSSGYVAAADLGRALALAGLTVATGGGPGAMEAANLGARSARSGDAAFDAALDEVARVPSYEGRMREWISSGLAARAHLDEPTDTLGVPTWHYGHEPPNVFQTAAAKYFRNAVREDILLRLATAGVIVLPGAGGTVQEIFQDACENSYADDATWSPLVLVGRAYWTERYPAWQLLQAVMAGRPGEAGIALVDSPAEAVRFLTESAR